MTNSTVSDRESILLLLYAFSAYPNPAFFLCHSFSSLGLSSMVVPLVNTSTVCVCVCDNASHFKIQTFIFFLILFCSVIPLQRQYSSRRSRVYRYRYGIVQLHVAVHRNKMAQGSTDGDGWQTVRGLPSGATSR